jgi:hypothetical protein
MKNLNNVIKEEIAKLFEAYDTNYMTINDVADIAADYTGYSADFETFRETFHKKFKKFGDKGVIDIFKDSTHYTLYAVRPGRYSYSPQIVPDDYEGKLEEYNSR